MALTTIINSSLSVKDATRSINIMQSQGLSDSASINVTEATYSLAASQADYQEVSKGDISTIVDVFITVVDRPETFAGISVGFGATTPSESFKMTDSFIMKGIIATKIWLKNLDTVAASIVLVTLVGTNA